MLSTSSSPSLAALGLFPVNLLAARLDDVQVEVDAVGVPDQGELGVADLDGDAADQLAPFAEPGQAEAVAIAGPGIVVGLTAPAAGILRHRAASTRARAAAESSLRSSERIGGELVVGERSRPASATAYSVRR